jgi:hypothetical protein
MQILDNKSQITNSKLVEVAVGLKFFGFELEFGICYLEFRTSYLEFRNCQEIPPK